MQTRKLTLSALFLALGLTMPFLTAQIPSIGSQLLPMHIPVLLSGYVLGPYYGAMIGFITPLLRSVLFVMPPIMTASCMAFELAAYGFFTGFFYRKLQRSTMNLYLSLLVSMLLGRLIWGIVSILFLGLNGSSFTFTMFITGGFVTAMPGIILQIILIPILVMTLRKAHMIHE